MNTLLPTLSVARQLVIRRVLNAALALVEQGGVRKAALWVSMEEAKASSRVPVAIHGWFAVHGNPNQQSMFHVSAGGDPGWKLIASRLRETSLSLF